MSAAADAGTTAASFGFQAAAGGSFTVLQGQRACGGGGVFFKTRPVIAAFQLVIAVQLDGHIAASLNAQGGLSISRNVSGVAHIDLHVFQGELQRRGSVVDHRNDVFAKAICRGRGCRGSISRGCLLGLGLSVCAFLLVGVFLLLVVLRLLSVLLVVVLRLVGVLRLLSVLRLGRGSRLVVVLYHRAKAGILCCGAFQVALLRGDGLLTGGDDDLTTVILGRSVLLDGLAMLIFGDGNIAVVDVVGICKGRSRQRHRNTQRCYQSCCPAECVVLLHRGNLLSFLRFFVVFTLYNTSQNTQPCFRTLRGGWNCFLRILFQNLMLHTQQTTSKTQLSYRKTLHP